MAAERVKQAAHKEAIHSKHADGVPVTRTAELQWYAIPIRDTLYDKNNFEHS